jgi:WD40 repeat protein
VAPPFTPTATITGGIVPFFGASLSFSADGSELAVGSLTDWNVFDATVDPLVWSARSSPAVRRLLRQLQASAGSLVSLSGEGSRVAVVDEGGSRMRIYQWSGSAFTRMGNVLTDFAAIVTSVALSADGLTVALGQAGNVEVFRFVAGANRWFPRGALTGASNVGSRLAFSDNGETLATPTSAEGDVTVFAWDLVDNQWFPLGEPIPGGNITVGALSASSAGHRVAIGGGGTVRVYSNIDSVWAQEGSTMMGSESSFGSTLAMTGAGDTLIVGASDSDEFLSNAGEVRFYGNVEGDWALIADTTYGAREDDRWGASVAISRNGRVVAISADQRDLVDFTGYVGIFEREI